MKTRGHRGRYAREMLSTPRKCAHCPNRTWFRCSFCLRPLCVNCRYVRGAVAPRGRPAATERRRPRGPWMCRWDCVLEPAAPAKHTLED